MKKTLVSLALGLGSFAGAPAAHAAVAANFAIPGGDVELTSFGPVDLSPQNGGAGPLEALHLRMTVRNDSYRPWTVDTREQRVDLEGYGTSVPAFATTDSGNAPGVMVAPGATRVVDLFFPLPADLQNPETLPMFDVDWTLHTERGVLAEQAPFGQIAIANEDYAPGYYVGGPAYWYNPDWDDHAFVGHVVVPRVYFGRPFAVHRHAQFQRFAPRGEMRREPVRGEERRYEPQRVQPRGVEPQRTAPQRTAPRRVQPQRVQPQRVQPQRAQPQRVLPQRNTPARPTPAPSQQNQNRHRHRQR